MPPPAAQNPYMFRGNFSKNRYPCLGIFPAKKGTHFLRVCHKRHVILKIRPIVRDFFQKTDPFFAAHPRMSCFYMRVPRVSQFPCFFLQKENTIIVQILMKMTTCSVLWTFKFCAAQLCSSLPIFKIINPIFFVVII